MRYIGNLGNPNAPDDDSDKGRMIAAAVKAHHKHVEVMAAWDAKRGKLARAGTLWLKAAQGDDKAMAELERMGMLEAP